MQALFSYIFLKFHNWFPNCTFLSIITFFGIENAENFKNSCVKAPKFALFRGRPPENTGQAGRPRRPKSRPARPGLSKCRPVPPLKCWQLMFADNNEMREKSKSFYTNIFGETGPGRTQFFSTFGGPGRACKIRAASTSESLICE